MEGKKKINTLWRNVTESNLYRLSFTISGVWSKINEHKIKEKNVIHRKEKNQSRENKWDMSQMLESMNTNVKASITTMLKDIKKIYCNEWTHGKSMWRDWNFIMAILNLFKNLMENSQRTEEKYGLQEKTNINFSRER